MRLDRVELLRKHTIAEYAAERGADDAHALLEPLLGTLYGFLVRRTPEPEDAEEALADTLLAARARAPKRAGDTRPLLDWLLSMALHTLRSRIEANPALESGLDHARADLPVRLRAGLLRALPRLSRGERLALGMRFADALPVAVIAQAMGRPERSVHTLLGTALASVGRACYPNLSLPQPEPEQLDCYVSTLHAGDHAVPPASLCAESAALVTALAELHTPVKIVPGVEERVWREYTERREEYLPGRPLPSAPTWLLPVGLVLLLALALGAGSLWLLSRQSPPEEPRRIAGAAPAPSATFAPASSEYTTTPTSPRPLYTPGPGRQALSELAGKLYFVQPGMVPELFSVHLGARDPAGLSTPERVLRFGPGTLTYDISPTDGTVAYSTGRGLWTQSAEGGIRYLAPLARLGPTGRPQPQRLRDSATTVRAHHATWHPQGHTVALVDAGWTPAGPGTGSAVYVYIPSLDTVLGEPLFVLGSDDEVTGLRWSTDGKYLAVRTRRGSHVVRVAAEGMRRRSFFLENRDVYWSPDPAIRDLLVTERRHLGVNAPFGVAEFDGTNYRLLGNAAFVSWQPDGKSVLFAQHGRRVDAGMSLWRLDLATWASEKMSDVPAMGRGVREVAFSPDGRYLAFTTAQGAWVASVSDGEAVELPGVSGRAHSLRWRGDPARYLPPRTPLSEPGTILYLRGLRSGNDPPRQTLNQLDPQTGKDIEVLAGAELGYAVSPFLTSVLVAADNRLELVALESGEITRLRTLPPSGQITALAWHPNGSEAAYVEDEHTATGRATVRLMSTDLRTALSTVLWKPDARNAPTTLAYAPSGRWLLLWNRYGWSLLPARGGRPVDLPRAGSATYAWRPGPGPDQLLRSDGESVVMDLRGVVRARLPAGLRNPRWIDRNTVFVQTQEGGTVRYDLRTRRTTPTRVQAVPRERFNPSPRGRYLLQGTLSALWAHDVQTGQRRWISSGGGGFHSPTWMPYPIKLESRFGRRPEPPVRDPGPPALFFTDLEADPQKSQSAFTPLWKFVRGERPERLADVSAWDVSPGGGEIVYVDRYGLWLLDVGTREERLVLPFEDGVTDPDTRLADPEWSPDGTLITFVVVPRDYGYRYFRHLPLGVYLVDPVTAKLHGRALAYSRNQNVTVATEWSAVGDTVLAAGVARTVEHDVATHRTLRTLPFGQTSEPKGSPLADDESVLYLAGRRGRVGTLMLRRDGRVYELSARAHAHVWSSGGDSVYFFEDAALWRASKDGTYKWRVGEALPGGSDALSPLWTQDGRLTYVADKTAWTVDPATGAVRRLLQWHNPLLEAQWGRAGAPR